MEQHKKCFDLFFFFPICNNNKQLTVGTPHLQNFKNMYFDRNIFHITGDA